MHRAMYTATDENAPAAYHMFWVRAGTAYDGIASAAYRMASVFLQASKVLFALLACAGGAFVLYRASPPGAFRHGGSGQRPLACRYEWFDEDGWKPYELGINQDLTSAAVDGKREVVVTTTQGATYLVQLQEPLSQTNKRTGFTRRVRRVDLAQNAEHRPPGGTVRVGSDSAERWELRFTDKVGFESRHFNQAAMQFAALTNNRFTVTQVDYYHCVSVEKKFQHKKHLLAGNTACWVFHETSDANICDIMVGGFKVGGDGVRRQNGSAHGRGVYTSTALSSRGIYNQGTNKVILAQGLKGHHGQGNKGGDSRFDSWQAGNPDWCIFRDPDQILPMYVIHYSDIDN
jgi:hypothetical protein